MATQTVDCIHLFSAFMLMDLVYSNRKLHLLKLPRPYIILLNHSFYLRVLLYLLNFLDLNVIKLTLDRISFITYGVCMALSIRWSEVFPIPTHALRSERDGICLKYHATRYRTEKIKPTDTGEHLFILCIHVDGLCLLHRKLNLLKVPSHYMTLQIHSSKLRVLLLLLNFSDLNVIKLTLDSKYFPIPTQISISERDAGYLKKYATRYQTEMVKSTDTRIYKFILCIMFID